MFTKVKTYVKKNWFQRNLNRLLLVVTLLYKNSYYESKDYFLRTNYFSIVAAKKQ